MKKPKKYLLKTQLSFCYSLAHCPNFAYYLGMTLLRDIIYVLVDPRINFEGAQNG